MSWISFWPWRPQYKHLFPFEITIGFPFGLLQFFLPQPAVSPVRKTVRVIDLNDMSSSFLEFNTFCYFCTFAHLDKTANGTVFRIVAVFCQERSGTFQKACQQGIKESGTTKLLTNVIFGKKIGEVVVYITNRIHELPTRCMYWLPHVITDVMSLRQDRLISHKRLIY